MRAAPIDGVDALYVPAGIPPGGRVPVAYLLTGRGNPVTAARRLGVAAAGDELSWQRRRRRSPLSSLRHTARGRSARR